ncbi:dihydrofolate reductase [Bradyrhizobium sp. LHD-71]|uniref:dihydrofolate reductase n=1 Tax=Bradyrhizobium sp. LHD-71 TaxID=3072141 RepID=UPI00280D519B|nr:dihydrofolate reductase [Bradyrhizobium sp. LHD-71]MDQ8729909.1 dihydrofolate reductase [Bradyrhizobium sp. LHD-71]
MADFHFEGCAIVSSDGMLADAQGNQPPELIVEADKRFFEAKLDAAALIVHGRHSSEGQRNSPNRKRLIATRQIETIEPDERNRNAVRWNPAGASIEQAAALLGVRAGLVAVIGGTEIFDLFLDRYDVFWLTLAPRVKLPGGVPAFSGVPQSAPAEILRSHGLTQAESRLLDASQDVRLVKWVRT